ncbi:MAG: amidase family protein, partial [Pseudomonadales bacterium]
DRRPGVDEARKAGASLGPLDGLPVLVKDNIETRDPLPPTAGSRALLDNYAEEDAPVVAALRAQGAVILGKTNLSQWANFRSNDSVSGWSSVGGQVRNPHVLDRSPCGSSSGSGAAVAAGLAPLALGTETNGSIICPAQVNGIVGLKPTHGLLSIDGIVPIAASQDTAGPMTRTVADAALMMDALAPGQAFYQQLARGIAGTRIVVARFAAGEDPRILARLAQAEAWLQEAGAEMVSVDAFEQPLRALGEDSFTVLKAEFRQGMEAYLARARGAFRGKTLADLIAFNEAEASRELARFDQYIFEASEALGPLKPDEHAARVARLRQAARGGTLDALLEANDAALIIAPSGPLAPPVDLVNGDLWPAWLGLGSAAAIAGYPHLTVPLGTIEGVPMGLSFLATAGQDALVLRAGYALEQSRGPAPRPAVHPTAPVAWGPPE